MMQWAMNVPGSPCVLAYSSASPLPSALVLVLAELSQSAVRSRQQLAEMSQAQALAQQLVAAVARLSPAALPPLQCRTGCSRE